MNAPRMLLGFDLLHKKAVIDMRKDTIDYDGDFIRLNVDESNGNPLIERVAYYKAGAEAKETPRRGCKYSRKADEEREKVSREVDAAAAPLVEKKATERINAEGSTRRLKVGGAREALPVEGQDNVRASNKSFSKGGDQHTIGEELEAGGPKEQVKPGHHEVRVTSMGKQSKSEERAAETHVEGLSGHSSSREHRRAFQQCRMDEMTFQKISGGNLTSRRGKRCHVVHGNEDERFDMSYMGRKTRGTMLYMGKKRRGSPCCTWEGEQESHHVVHGTDVERKTMSYIGKTRRESPCGT